MANNVKPGDLAILVSDERPENIGVIVLVIEQYRARWSDETGVMWLCTSEGRPLMCDDIENGVRTGIFTPSTEFVVYDRQLRPIRGLPLEDEVNTPKEISLA